MAVPLTSTSCEGSQWTKEGGLGTGLPSFGVIKPETNLKPKTRSEDVYSIAIIGAGYAGLTAARDLTSIGQQVLLLEARDRIGGRTWSSDIGGYPFELGGTWVHWIQPYVWTELARYKLTDELEVSPSTEGGIMKFILSLKGENVTMDHEEAFGALGSALQSFVNVDDQLCRTIIPFPHNPHYNAVALKKYDRMSLADRFSELGDKLTPPERDVLEAILSVQTGGTMENSSFWDLLRAWALSNYNWADYLSAAATYKLRRGQSHFARCMFDEAANTGRLDYAFSTPVAGIKDVGNHTEITSKSGAIFLSRRVVCTVPLNVLHELPFTPPLSPLKREASVLGHASRAIKINVEAENPELRSLGGLAHPPGKVTYVFGDGTTPTGNTHIVSLGTVPTGVGLQPAKDIKEISEALRLFADNMEITRLVFHDWNKDPYSRGTWSWYQPGMATKYVAALRERQGNVFFASADWATAWRGCIDGAIEDGKRVAKEIADEIKEGYEF